jgi:tocopherol cyclase
MSKNRYQLTKRSSKNGYDWWWHSFVATNAQTGELKPFFIEYYVINPGLWKDKIILGQQKESKAKREKPCYAMLKVGTWGHDKIQLHNFYSISDFYASNKELNCKIGTNELYENKLFGEVHVSEHERDTFPELMSDAGSLKWDLTVEKDVYFDVGYGSSKLFNWLGAFHMYWHIQGMRSKFSGELLFNNQRYIVNPETSFGYQDKNWGKDYTNPWIWLNCNNFKSKKTGKPVDASFDLGGGCPKVFGISLPKRILTAFYYNGEFTEFNFSKFWKKSKQQFSTHEDDNFFYWNVVSENKNYKIDLKFRCEKSKLLKINYENPNGEKKHTKLWSGGHAEGSLVFYKKEDGNFRIIDELEGSLGGCEYGEY